MGRPIRNTKPEYFRHISIRTLNAQLLLVPSEELNKIVGGIIAKYQQRYGIIIYAFIVLSNHIHLLVQAPKRNLWRFEKAINSEIALRINWFRKRKGVFWGRRYDEQACPRVDDAMEALLYVLCNAVSHGLVKSPEKWPGLCSYQQSLDGIDRCYPVVNYTEYNKAKRRALSIGEKVRIADYTESYPLKISRLPVLKELSDQAWSEFLEKAVEARCSILVEERRKNDKGFFGEEQVVSQSPWDFPLNIKYSPRPVCYSKCLEVKNLFKEWYDPWVAAYKEASRKLRQGIWDAVFPSDSLPPPLHYAVTATDGDGRH